MSADGEPRPRRRYGRAEETRRAGALAVTALTAVLIACSTAHVAAASQAPPGSLLIAQRVSNDTGWDCTTPRCRWYQLWRASASGPITELRRLGAHRSYEGAYFAPTLSPDEALLAYSTHAGRVAVVPVDLAADRRTGLPTLPPIHGRMPPWMVAWSPRGTKLAYMGPFSGLRIVGRNGGVARSICDCTMDWDSGPGLDWSGVGIAFSNQSHRVDSYGVIMVVNPDGTGLHRITSPGDSGDARPTWSPDGSKIAFVRGGDAFGQEGSVWVISATGGRPKRVSPEGIVSTVGGHPQRAFTGAAPAWSPDGRYLAMAVEIPAPGGPPELALSYYDFARGRSTLRRLPHDLAQNTGAAYIDRITWIR